MSTRFPDACLDVLHLTLFCENCNATIQDSCMCTTPKVVFNFAVQFNYDRVLLHIVVVQVKIRRNAYISLYGLSSYRKLVIRSTW